MAIRQTAVRVQVPMDCDLVAWVDGQAERMGRSRAWMIETAMKRWQARLDRERERRAQKRRQAAERALR